MNWIVRIEGENEKKERIRITFDPMAEQIHFYGEYKVHIRANNVPWKVFSEHIHGMKIDLETMKSMMEKCIVDMRIRVKEYENLDKGLGVIKWVGLEEDED